MKGGLCQGHGLRLTKAVHWDYLYLGGSFGTSKYVLVIKDDSCHFCELYVWNTANSEAAAEAMSAWISHYEMPRTWISDNGSHFKNDVANSLCK